MEKNEIYKCEICGNIVELITVGGGELVCCGQPMDLMPEQTADFANEKHVPMIEESESGIIIKVGSTEHPMTEDHHIEWIQIIDGEKIERKFLRAGEKPEAEFQTKNKNVIAREYCNVHGLWRN